MARYRAKDPGFVNGSLVKPGEVFDFSGPPGSWMEPMDDGAVHEVDVSPEPGPEERKAKPKKKGSREVI